MNSNVSMTTSTAVNSLPLQSYESDEESFVVLERESMNPSLNIQPIEDYLSLVSKQTDDTKSLIESKHESSSASSIDDIQNRVVELLEENKQLKETLQQNNLAIKRQMETICTWQLEMQKVHQNHKEKFAETKLYIDNLRKENMTLKENLKQSEFKITALVDEQTNKKMEQQVLSFDNTSAIRKEYESLTEIELQAAQKKICDLETTLKTIQITNPHEELVADLKRKLTASNLANEKLIQELEAQRKEFERKQEQFWKDIEELKKRQAENTKNENIQEILQNLRQQLMHAQERITLLTSEKQALEAMLREKDGKLQGLQDKYSEASHELETITVLKMQLDLYKTDFEAERTTANALKIEKEKITEDLTLIQQRNEQLLREIEQLRTTLNITGVPNTSRSSNFADLAPKQEYACPKCSFCFRNLTALENHVYRCIELDALP